MGAKYSAVHCMRSSMQQVTEDVSARKAAGYRYCHNQWTKLNTSGDSPSPRSGHDVVVIGNKAYLFGGCGGEQDQITCLNDVYVFNLELHRWSKVTVKGDAPLPRASFGMCAGPAPGTLIVAGGTGVEMDSLRADVVEYNVPNRTWTQILTDSEETPCKFYGQSVCTYGDNLLLFGGSTGLHYTNDLFEYNVRTNKWKRLVTSGRMPSPRYKHQAVVVGHKMYVIGGGCFKPEQSGIDLYCLDLRSLVWEETIMKGELPKARVAHSCSFDAETDTIYLWGGFTSELSRLQDFFGFHCPTATWVRMAEEPTQAPVAGGATDLVGAPPARAFHSAAFFQGGLYVFSGANGDVRYSDVWRFQVRSTPPSLSMLVAHKIKSGGEAPLKEMDMRAPAELVQGVREMNEHADRLC
ncbi:unnamed protein product [Ectocarpus sp. 12 AP-2014]